MKSLATVLVRLRAAACGAVVVLLAASAAAHDVAVWRLWRAVAVRDGERQKPLETVATDTLRRVTHQSTWRDPVTQERLDATTAYLMLLFDWQGWEHRDKDQLARHRDWRRLYAHLHVADKWDKAASLPIGSRGLAAALGLDVQASHVSPEWLVQAKVLDRKTERLIPFSTWAEKLQASQDGGDMLTELELKGIELAKRLWLYQDHRMGRGLKMVPVAGQDHDSWLSLGELLLAQMDETTDPAGELTKLQDLLKQTRTSYLECNTADFARASQQFLASLRRQQAVSGEGVSARAIDLEVALNRWAPFRLGWIAMTLAAVGMWLHVAVRWNSFFFAGVTALAIALLAILIGFGLRAAITARLPVITGYESVVFVGAGVAMLGWLFCRVAKTRSVLPVASTLSALILAVADSAPLMLNPGLELPNIVHGNTFWLGIQVLASGLSYAAFTLALGTASVTLWHFAAGCRLSTMLSSHSRVTILAIQTGVLFLVLGMMSGCLWADQSWGRLWSWDRKEVWSLIALFAYGGALQACKSGWIHHRGMAILAAACYALIVVSWYGSNDARDMASSREVRYEPTTGQPAPHS